MPEPATFHLTTPIITDIVQPVAGTAGRAVPVAHRAFPAGSRLFAAFDVMGATASPAGAPQVTLSYVLRRADGTQVGGGQPQALRPNARGQFSVTMGVTLPQGATGDHELVLRVSDAVSGRTVEVVEPLTVTR